MVSVLTDNKEDEVNFLTITYNIRNICDYNQSFGRLHHIVAPSLPLRESLVRQAKKVSVQLDFGASSKPCVVFSAVIVSTARFPAFSLFHSSPSAVTITIQVSKPSTLSLHHCCCHHTRIHHVLLQPQSSFLALFRTNSLTTSTGL